MPKARPIKFDVTEDGCFIVTSHKQGWKGYIPFTRGQQRTRLHRYIYEELKGEIPKGLVVRHTCDRPNCIAPEHLILGTPAENSADMVRRGRSMRGEKHIKATLTEKDAQTIVELLQAGFDYKHIADSFGVHRATVYGIKSGKTWKHLNYLEGEAK